MNFMEWSKSSVDYGQKLVSSAIEGAREGEDEFLGEEALSPYLTESARHALGPAVVGVYLGALSGSIGHGHRSTSKTLACGLLGGAIITETIFSWPGLGRLVVTAVYSRDYPTIRGAILLIASTFIIVNLLVDMCYALLDPRIRYS